MICVGNEQWSHVGIRRHVVLPTHRFSRTGLQNSVAPRVPGGDSVPGGDATVPKVSAGLLVYRPGSDGGIEVLLVHPGGPFWARKDAGAWSIPKGQYDGEDDPAARAEAEFVEELGQRAPAGPRLDLGEVRQAGGKRVRAWAVRGDIDAGATTS